MLIGVQIINCLSIENLSINGIPKVSFYTGLNDSGKNNLFKAIHALKLFVSRRTGTELGSYLPKFPNNGKGKFSLTFDMGSIGIVSWGVTFDYGNIEDCMVNRGLDYILDEEEVRIDNRLYLHKSNSPPSFYDPTLDPRMRILMDKIYSILAWHPEKTLEFGDMKRGSEELKLLNIFFPSVVHVYNPFKANMLIEFEDGMRKEEYEIGKGFYRILSLVRRVYTSRTTVYLSDKILCISPDYYYKLIQFFYQCKKQLFIITQDSALINYISDKHVKDCLFYIYRDKNNYTTCKRFFDIPNMADKLTSMGPGEVLIDTDLEMLNDELNR